MSWLDDLTFETVVVHTKAGTSLRGLKATVHDDGILLREACLMEETGVVMLDGEPFIPRESVDFMQIIGPVS